MAITRGRQGRRALAIWCLDLDCFIYAFVRKEAVISSQIEGTQAALVDLLAFEAEEGPAPNADMEAVTNYLDTLAYARDQLASKQGLPISMRS
ncbi:Fic/DOC family N-terminal domain-containing protein [Mesorhizobium sp. M0977]|uniref:Fic/DOC family N-terminal domain-containing protein n=1 Tax=Mesorhizobium sp. M0977 TaxID=2957039 RepID=UPI003339AC56